jgi:predicted RNA-binding protein with EMAP domain
MLVFLAVLALVVKMAKSKSALEINDISISTLAVSISTLTDSISTLAWEITTVEEHADVDKLAIANVDDSEPNVLYRGLKGR